MKKLLIFLVLSGTVFGQSNIRYDNFTHAVQKPPTSSGSIYDYDFTGLNIHISGISGILPVGGTTGQKLVKLSNTDYDVGWATSTGVPGGSTSQFQINNSGAFGGTGVYTTNGTFVTVQADNVQYVQSGAGTKKFTLDGSHITAGTTRNVRIADGSSATVIGASATANNYVTNIDATGTQQIAQPTFTNMSDKLVDGQSALYNKPVVSAVATANQTLSGHPTIDGVTVTDSDVVLVTGQSTGSQNGPWLTLISGWGRPAWYTSGSTVQAFAGSNIFCKGGTLYTGTRWILSTAGTITIDTTNTSWSEVQLAINSTSVSNGVTGTGAVVLATSPTLVTPLLGTPTSGDFSTGTFTWPTFNQNTTGSAAKWTTARTLALTGDVTYTSGSFDGSGNATGTATLANIPAIAGTNLTGTGASFTAGNATKLTTGRTISTTGDVTYTSGSFDGSGNVTGTATLANIPAIAGTNLTGTGASFTAGNATKWTTGRTVALTGDVTYTSGSLDGSGNVTGTATLANIPAIAGTNLTGTADGLTAGDVTRNHAVYAGASPPTVDVGLFTISKTGVNLKASGNTTGFVVPTGRAFVCTGSWALVTAVTTPGAGTETWTIKESGASATMLGGTASGSGTPAVGTYYSETSREAGGPYTQCAAGNTVTIVVATSQAGSTAVTGTVFIQGFYTQ